jgi:hypothetical protein
MRRRGRVRRVGKWAGVAVCVILLAGQVVGRFGFVEWWADGFLLSVSGGAVRIAWWQPTRFEGALKAAWYPRKDIHWTLLPYNAWPVRDVLIPLWIFAVAIAVPTTVLWWLDRRRLAPGHCPCCGYDLTGNVSGRCPECGAQVGASSD